MNRDRPNGQMPMEVRAALLEQEHRLYSLITNYIDHRSRDAADPLRKAASKAFWRRIIVALLPAAAAGTAGIAGIASVFVAVLALSVTKRANDLIETQNLLAEANRRASLVFELSSILDQVGQYIETEEARRAETGKAYISPQEKYTLPRYLRGRIMAISRSLRPYRFIDDNEVLVERPLSPERGQLFISLLESNVRTGSSLVNLDLSYADLRRANLQRANLSYVNLRYADLRPLHQNLWVHFGSGSFPSV